MRDVIDRVTARALGSESMLSPRLPSLFEPQRSSPTGLPEEAREMAAPAAHQAMLVEREVATPRETPVSPVNNVVREAATVPSITMPEPHTAVPHGMDDERALVTPIARGKGLEPEEPRLPSSRPSPALLERPIPSAHVQRERSPNDPSATEGRTVADEGSLLVPAQSVFRTPSAPTGTVGTRFRAAHAGQAMQAETTHEPVVHVSIGRLEVRATPTPGKLAQRQDAPRTSPLDDYLRQRGKASS